MIKSCETCGAEFKARKYSIERGRGRFCSRACAGPAISKKKLNLRSKNTTCGYCGRASFYSKKLKDGGGIPKKICSTCDSRRRRVGVKRACVEYLGGKCQLCLGVFPDRVYDFHHRNPREKSFEIGSSTSRNWDILRVELDKCDLLCANCHRIQHIEHENL